MSELDKARGTRRLTKIVAAFTIGFTCASEWGTNVGWLALASCFFIGAALTGIEQEFRRASDAIARAEGRSQG